jgi:hypothetical protein
MECVSELLHTAYVERKLRSVTLIPNVYVGSNARTRRDIQFWRFCNWLTPPPHAHEVRQ